MPFDREDTVFHVVVNAEGQYSIWPEYMPIPGGWEREGTTGKKQVCLEHIDKVWTDMRPKSLRDYMQAQAAGTSDADSSSSR